MNVLEGFLAGQTAMDIATHEIEPTQSGEGNKNYYINAVIEAICRNQLATLRTWCPTLESLPEIKKSTIWKTCQVLPAFSNFVQESFELTIEQWAVNPFRHMSSIAVLYSAIVFLQNEGLLPEITHHKPDFMEAENMNNNNIHPATQNFHQKSHLPQRQQLPQQPLQQQSQPPQPQQLPQQTSQKPRNNNNYLMSYQIPRHDLYIEPQNQPQHITLHHPLPHPQEPSHYLPPPSHIPQPLPLQNQQLVVCSNCHQLLRYPAGSEVIRCPKCNTIIVPTLSQHQPGDGSMKLHAKDQRKMAPKLLNNSNNRPKLNNGVSPKLIRVHLVLCNLHIQFIQ